MATSAAGSMLLGLMLPHSPAQLPELLGEELQRMKCEAGLCLSLSLSSLEKFKLDVRGKLFTQRAVRR